MKKFSLTIKLITVIGAACFVWSCGKTDGPAPDAKKPTTTSSTVTSAEVPGYWFGSFQSGTINQSILFRSNGTVKVYDFYYNPTSTDTTQAYDGTGTWEIKNNKVYVQDSFPNGESFIDSATYAPGPPAKLNFTGGLYTEQ
jgi:hypothetical protein